MAVVVGSFNAQQCLVLPRAQLYVLTFSGASLGPVPWAERASYHVQVLLVESLKWLTFR